MTQCYEIYLITAPGYWYVGSTKVGYKKRFKQHLTGHGRAPLLWDKILQLGKEAFHISLLESSVDDRFQSERGWYEYHMVQGVGQSLNSRRPGEYPEHTLESRAKLSAIRKGKPGTPHTDAWKLERSQARKGYVVLEETKEKISATLTGRTLTPEHCAVLQALMTSERRVQIGDKLRGRKLPSEHRDKVIQTLTANSIRVECDECDLVTTPGPFVHHQNRTGHTGRKTS
jgi:hypothetical protein